MRIPYLILYLIIFLLLGSTVGTIAQPTLAGGSGAQDQTICIDDAIDDIVFNVSGAEPVVVFNPVGSGLEADWNDGPNNLTISGIPQFTVTYTVTDENDMSVSGTITVNTESTAPTGITGPTSICLGEDATLSAQGGVAGTGATFQWYTGSCGGTLIPESGSSITVSPGSNTNYFVRRTGTCNTTTCTSFSLTVNSLSTAPTSISGTTTICQLESTLLSAIGGTGGTGSTFQWYEGGCGLGPVLGVNATLEVTPTVTTTYFVRRTGTCNTTSCASTTVTVNTLSTAPTSISGTSSICENESTLLTAVGGVDGTGASFQWYAGGCGIGSILGTSGTLNVTPLSTTTYFVRRTGTCNTTTCASLTVTVNTPSTAPATISGNSAICPGESTTLTATGGTSGTGALFQWYAGGCGSGSILGTNSTLNASPSSTTTYFVRRSGICNTTTCASLTVIVKTLSTEPASISGYSGPICPGDCVTLIANGGSLGTGASYHWYEGTCADGLPQGNNQILNVCPEETTQYSVNILGDCNTTECISVVVATHTLSTTPDISGAGAICSGNSTTLTAVGGIQGTGAVYEWFQDSCGVGSPIGSNQTYEATTGGTYFVRLVGTCNETDCDSIVVIESTTPDIISMSDTVCSGAEFEVIPEDGVNGIVPDSTHYAWELPDLSNDDMTPGTAGQNQSSISNIHSHNSSTDETATYTVFATAPGGCVSSFTLIVTVVPGPGINSIPDATFCNGEPIEITPFTSTSSNVSWVWEAQNPEIGIDAGEGNIIPDNPAIFYLGDLNATASTNVIVTATTTCSSVISFSITVYPTPVSDTLSDLTFCEGVPVSGIPFDGLPNNVAFNYQSSGDAIGLSETSGAGVDGISPFITLSNLSPSSSATILVTPIANSCTGSAISFQITVIEAPAPPIINDDWNDNVLCGNSYGQIVSVQTSFPASFSWTATGSISIIAGFNNENCIVNFLEPDTATLTVTADYGGCTNSSTEIYIIGEAPDPPLCASIVSTPDGNGLVCLNNNVDSYQWGIINTDANSSGWLDIEIDDDGTGNDQFYYGYLWPVADGNKIWVELCRDGCCTTIFYPDGCTDSPILAVLDLIGWNNGIKAYPNPTSGIIHISLPADVGGLIAISITDIAGNRIYERTENSQPYEIKNLNMSDFSPGIYFVHLKDARLGNGTIKVLKQ